MNGTSGILGVGVTLAIGIALSAPLAAQVQPDPRTETIDEIIVTTERREQSIQDVAGSVQSFSADDLRRDGVNGEIRNLQLVVPGLSIANQEGNVEIFIRGVGSANNTELGDPAAATHIDGVYLPRPRGLGAMFFDLERVEVNKGPQGTLRGRNAVAGSLNIITRKPSVEGVEGYLQSEFGNFNHRALEGALNLPINDTMAVRIAGFSEQRDATFNNVGNAQNIEAAGSEDELALRAQLLWNPTDRLRFLAKIDYVAEGGTGYPGANLFPALSSGNRADDLELRDVVYRGWQGDLDNEHTGVSLNVVYDFDAFSVEYSGSRRYINFAQTNGANIGVLYPGLDINTVDYDNRSNVFWEQTSDAYIHELRFYSDDDSRLIWSAGAFHQDEDQQTGFGSFNDKGIFFSGVEFTMPEVEVSSTAVFLNGTYSVTDNVRLKAGYRYTEEEKFRFGIGGNWTLGLGGENLGNGNLFDCCFQTRLGTEGFFPSFLSRPNFTAPTNNAEAAAFLLQGASFGQRDTLAQQLLGVANGTNANANCVDTPDTNPDGRLTCRPDGEHSFFTLGAPVQQIGQAEFDFNDWRLGIEMDLGDDHLFYGLISTGHKSGGFNDTLGDGTSPLYDPEEVVAYELGSKNVFDSKHGQIIANASLFYYDYTDQVFQSLIGFGGAGPSTGLALLNENVADSEILGLEFFGRLPLPAGFSVDFTYLFLDAEAKSGELADVRGQDFGVSPSVANIDLAGNTLPLVSDHSLIIKLQQSVPTESGLLQWQVLGSYRSDYFLSIFNEDDIVRPDGSGICGSNDAIVCGFENHQEGYVQFNAGISYLPNQGNWRAEAYVTNIFDEEASQKALLGNNLNLRFINLPRTGGIRLRYDF